MRRNTQLLIISLVLVLIAAWIAWPNNPGINFLGFQKEFKTVLGLDLVGGVQALLEADVPSGTDVDADKMSTVVQIIENRVNGLGVSEAVVQRVGTRRVIVESPGEQDPEKLLSSIKQTGSLEFVDMSTVAQEEIAALQQNQTAIATTIQTSNTEPISPTQKVFTTLMTGSVIKNAQVTTDETGQYQVGFELDSEGAQIFKDFTSQHVGDILAIVLDKKIISAPQIQDTIPDGQGVIRGNFTYDEANTLAVQLRYGALPIPLKIVESRTVGPTLGQDSLRSSLIAGLVGFTIVILFMAIYYRLPGILADVAIILYVLFSFAIFRYIPVTLTLAGIAGFLLSTGSALDANILVFERMKEELRAGRTVSQAIEQGWKRAWPSIRDSNFAILITCGILYWFGGQFGATIVKGFSVTLALGVLVSLFTAIVVTRALLGLVFQYFKPSNLTKWFGL